MKERIVIDNKAFLNKTDFVCIEDIVKDLKVEYEVEKQPETFEELKELCKDVNVNLKISREGKIYCHYCLFAENRTYAQMWQIIKNLVGE